MVEGCRLRVQDYTVGWISALPIEQSAATAILDEEHPLPENFDADKNDLNLYLWSNRFPQCRLLLHERRLIWHTSAAWAAAHLATKFPSISFGLLVGIGGGVPSHKTDIRLGDVVISSQTGQSGGVVRYDFGKHVPDGGFLRTGYLNSPPPLLLNALSHIRGANFRDKIQCPDAYLFLACSRTLPSAVKEQEPTSCTKEKVPYYDPRGNRQIPFATMER